MNTKNQIYILGISCNIHQSAASLTADGVLIAAVEEERFTRKKYDSRFPISAIEYCLKETGIKLSDVQYAGFYWQPWKGLFKRLFCFSIRKSGYSNCGCLRGVLHHSFGYW